MTATVEFLAPVLPDNPSEWAPVDAELVEALRPTAANHGLLTPAQKQHLEHIAAGRWFLMRNVWRARSAQTNRIEDYYTLEGIERPHCGLAPIVARIATEMGQITHEHESLVDMVSSRFNKLVELGGIEPITAQRAQELSFRIAMASRGRYDLWGDAQKGVIS